jgi:hypothetical protein
MLPGGRVPKTLPLINADNTDLIWVSRGIPGVESYKPFGILVGYRGRGGGGQKLNHKGHEGDKGSKKPALRRAIMVTWLLVIGSDELSCTLTSNHRRSGRFAPI